jgi:hypothetical protein
MIHAAGHAACPARPPETRDQQQNDHAGDNGVEHVATVALQVSRSASLRDTRSLMSQVNVAVLHRFIGLWNSGDAELAVDMLAPGFELHSPFSSVAGEPYRGADGYRRWQGEIVDQFEVWRIDPIEIRVLGEDRLVAIGSVHVRGRGSGIELDQPAAAVVDFRDGLVSRVSIHLDEAEALAAAEPPAEAP